MKKIKEKPKTGKAKGAKSKSQPALAPRQAAKLMKDKYRRQLDQCPEGRESETTQAIDQLEDSGQFVADELAVHTQPHRSRQRDGRIKEKFRRKAAGPAPESDSLPVRPAGVSAQNALSAKERSTLKIKERDSSLANPSIPSIYPTGRPEEPQVPRLLHSPLDGSTPSKEAARKRTIDNQRRSPAIRRRRDHIASTTERRQSVNGTTPKGRRAAHFRERAGSGRVFAGWEEHSKVFQSTAQQRMKRQTMRQTVKAAKAPAAVFKRAAQAIKTSAHALAYSAISLAGSGVLLLALIMVIAIAAVANSPFGLFFAEERSAPDTVSVAEAVGTVNVAYNAKLEELQAGDYDSIDVTGTAADWSDVLAVFATRYAGAEDGVDVATLDADRVSKLTATFWDMTALTSAVETIDHPDSDPDDDTDDSWTERILHLTITAKTAEDMKTAYGFTAYQISALDELLADWAALSSLAGSLAITSVDAATILNALPDDLSPERRKAVETALQLVGKVNYFWGGKSYVIGWDSRWGQLMKVISPGSPTTGTYRPFGLDCSGFLDWTLRNAGLHSDGHWYIGTNLAEVPQAKAQPGDMALNGDASHIGMVVGRDSVGRLLICHCSSGKNNVVVSEFSASGFTTVGRPAIYGP